MKLGNTKLSRNLISEHKTETRVEFLLSKLIVLEKVHKRNEKL